MAKAAQLDFTNVKDGGNFNKKHQEPGDYKAKITKVEDAVSKSDGKPMWLFTITAGQGGSYAYYCKLVDNQLWKIRNIFIAAGVNVPKKRLKVDPNKLVGKDIAVTLEDEEYDGKMQSTISTTFPLSELEGEEVDAEDDDDDEDDEEETEEEDEEDDEEDEDEEDEEEAPKSKGGKKKGKGKPTATDDDAEMEELDIEDI